jgi:hypothetical protein
MKNRRIRSLKNESRKTTQSSQVGQKSGSRILIPVIELSSGKQLIVDYNDLQTSNKPIPKTLSEPLRQRIRKLHKKISDVHSTNLQGFENTLKTEGHPEREIRVFELIAETYQEFIQCRSLSFDMKKEIYGSILSLSFGVPAKNIIDKCRIISVNDILDLINLWKQTSKGVNTLAQVIEG